MESRIVITPLLAISLGLSVRPARMSTMTSVNVRASLKNLALSVAAPLIISRCTRSCIPMPASRKPAMGGSCSAVATTLPSLPTSTMRPTESWVER